MSMAPILPITDISCFLHLRVFPAARHGFFPFFSYQIRDCGALVEEKEKEKKKKKKRKKERESERVRDKTKSITTITIVTIILIVTIIT